MKHPFKTTRLLPLGLVTILLCGAVDLAMAQDNQAKVKVGEKAPEFTLQDQDGKKVALKELIKKKPTALVFYRSADW